MKPLLLYAIFWLFSGGLYVHGNAGEIGQQTWEPYTPAEKERQLPRLKDIEVTNPLFIFK